MFTAIKKEGNLIPVIHDDGIGFVFEEKENHSKGLLNLRQRTNWFVGQLVITSQPKNGTTVSTGCPLANEVQEV